ncbi:MAG: hypothetical protein BJ554DRAFT_8248 [Olpidium bornovanus]|uniref:Uncharacterized protein n=1 Tax=Olpidium bornovanus TaxID=278681 RepID=A0A8H7ZUV3_9FUNG|nr:MAG: hypothetical protein BJ554DRAFT_8248 [Olpidium bornovanus]
MAASQPLPPDAQPSEAASALVPPSPADGLCSRSQPPSPFPPPPSPLPLAAVPALRVRLMAPGQPARGGRAGPSASAQKECRAEDPGRRRGTTGPNSQRLGSLPLRGARQCGPGTEAMGTSRLPNNQQLQKRNLFATPPERLRYGCPVDRLLRRIHGRQWDVAGAQKRGARQADCAGRQSNAQSSRNSPHRQTRRPVRHARPILSQVRKKATAGH